MTEMYRGCAVRYREYAISDDHDTLLYNRTTESAIWNKFSVENKSRAMYAIDTTGYTFASLSYIPVKDITI